MTTVDTTTDSATPLYEATLRDLGDPRPVATDRSYEALRKIADALPPAKPARKLKSAM